MPPNPTHLLVSLAFLFPRLAREVQGRANELHAIHQELLCQRQQVEGKLLEATHAVHKRSSSHADVDGLRAALGLAASLDSTGPVVTGAKQLLEQQLRPQQQADAVVARLEATVDRLVGGRIVGDRLVGDAQGQEGDQCEGGEREGGEQCEGGKQCDSSLESDAVDERADSIVQMWAQAVSAKRGEGFGGEGGGDGGGGDGGGGEGGGDGGGGERSEREGGGEGRGDGGGDEGGGEGGGGEGNETVHARADSMVLVQMWAQAARAKREEGAATGGTAVGGTAAAALAARSMPATTSRQPACSRETAATSDVSSWWTGPPPPHAHTRQQQHLPHEPARIAQFASADHFSADPSSTDLSRAHPSSAQLSTAVRSTASLSTAVPSGGDGESSQAAGSVGVEASSASSASPSQEGWVAHRWLMREMQQEEGVTQGAMRASGGTPPGAAGAAPALGPAAGGPAANGTPNVPILRSLSSTLQFPDP